MNTVPDKGHADTNRDGVLLLRQSHQKLQQTAQALQTVLMSFPCNDNDDDNNSNDNSNTDDDTNTKRPTTPIIRCQPCQSIAEAEGYRCRCSFQIIIQQQQPQVSSDNHPPTTSAVRRRGYYQYAVRENGTAVPLAQDTFRIANWRIQQAMQQLWTDLNHDNDDDVTILTQHLTSVTFVTSWDPGRSCWVTLHYHVPVSSSSSSYDKNKEAWMQAAQKLTERHHWQQLTRRSKGVVWRARPRRQASSSSSSSSLSLPPSSSPPDNHQELVVEDTVYLHYNTKVKEWKVSLDKQILATKDHDDDKNYNNNTSINNNHDNDLHNYKESNIIEVQYVKPESAFAHPNANVMCQALAWMLNRLQSIVVTTSINNASSTVDHDGDDDNTHRRHRLTMLELYCGCGAHTMALMRSGLLKRIVAVELDERLVQACRYNAKLNANATTTTTTEPDCALEIVSQDAGLWSTMTNSNNEAAAADSTTTATSTTAATVSGDVSSDTDLVLLVDPPRQGLDARVCQMAMKNTQIQHVLYISCGREALVRDLEILHQIFDVKDCLLLDLFPQTYSVESLVHLQRRPSA